MNDIPDNLKIYNCDNLSLMATLSNESIDVICIDPPYLYLKNQKLERVFDEPVFFTECKRLLTKDGFIVMFGRGVSFYRWNTILDELGFTFKEEIVWDKSYTSSPLSTLSRVHETISIFCKGNAGINRVKVPYIEMKANNIDSIVGDINRLKTTYKNTTSLNAVLEYLQDGTITYAGDYLDSTTISGAKKRIDRCVTVVSQICVGMNEKSIVKEIRDHYTSIHPTQKPVRLLERLLALVIPNKPRNEIVVADFFGGSMSCMEAVYNLGMNGIATEIDEEYFNLGKERLQKLQTKLF